VAKPRLVGTNLFNFFSPLEWGVTGGNQRRPDRRNSLANQALRHRKSRQAWLAEG
jgi:hypothetical protein